MGVIKCLCGVFKQEGTYISVAMNPVSSDRNRKRMKTQQRMETAGKHTQELVSTDCGVKMWHLFDFTLKLQQPFRA